MENQFIITFSSESAGKLIRSGYHCVDNKNGSWLFLDNGSKKLSFDTLEKTTYTNKMFL